MAMNGETLGDAIADKITASNASEEAKAAVKSLWEEVGKVIVNHIKNNLEVQIPSSTVITSVTGQATGNVNISPISITVVG